jgi:hypothetical protein
LFPVRVNQRDREFDQSHRHVERNVKRWRGGQMVLRWTAKGHADVPKLVAALRDRDQQLGTTVSAGNVAENVST